MMRRAGTITLVQFAAGASSASFGAVLTHSSARKSPAASEPL